MGGRTIAALIPRLLLALFLCTVALASVARPAEARSHRHASALKDASGITDPVERAEIRKVLDLIAAHGPFKHRQDGVVFSNREGRLPAKARGFYHEYTVETPGSSDRGARRIIRGEGGETYYTRDHYRTFLRIDPETFR